MKSEKKELIRRARPELLKSLDVHAVLPALRQSGHISGKEEKNVTAGTARRMRVTALLDLLVKKKTEAFEVFVDALEDQYTHLYLQLTGFEDNHDDGGDAWSFIRRVRSYLIAEMDAMKVAPGLAEKQVITEVEFKEIRSAGDTTKQTECLVDILETKPPTFVDVVIDTIGDSYPHLYLILTDDTALDDDGDHDYFDGL